MDTFCPIPWIFQAVRNNGDIRICCQANITKNQGVVRHKDGTSYNAGRDSMLEARNADLMLEVRKNMLAGKWSDECARCKQEETSGLNSRRQYEQETYPNATIEWAKTLTQNNGTINPAEVPLSYYDLRFGNLCNLACRMCGPTDSHTWYEQWLGYHGGDGFQDTHGYVKLEQNNKNRLSTTDYDWHSSESFWNQLEKNIPYIEHVYMAGGEPMMIERHYEFLQTCIDMDRAQHMIIEYNTNMTNLPNRVLKMWEHFKQVRVGASIDGMGKVLEYQRWPIKWDHALKNLQKLDNTPNNIVAWLAFTVTAYNVWHVPEFMWWKITESNFKKINSTKRRPIITHHVAHGPKRANIKLLPAHLKEELKKEYNKWIDKFKSASINENTQNNAESILTSILNYAYAQDLTNWQEISTEHNQAEFIRFTQYIDSQRNQNIIDIVPQYKELFYG